MDDADFLADLDRWLADAGANEVARMRSQQRTLIDAAAQEATLTSTALQIAERGDVVVVRAGGRSHRGRVLAVGLDFVVLREGDGAPTLVPFGAIGSVRPHPELPMEGPGAARRAPIGASFAAVLGGIAADRPRVHVRALHDDEVLTGELRAVGADVATIYLDGPNRPRAFVRIASISAVTLLDAG